MSKGLEALEKLRLELLEVSDYLDQKDVSYLGPIHRIEEELKRLEEIDNILNTGGGIWAENGIVSKELKALEIIKKHPMFYLHDDLPQGTYRMYDCELYGCYDLTKEEYELLAEVLKR